MNLSKSIKNIFEDNYVVPLYQRNFSWEEVEINQFLEDIYDAYSRDSNGNYYIGSLVVLKRDNGDFEVIDGQQRLTVITLISKLLGLEDVTSFQLKYDSRPEVEAFFHFFLNSGKTGEYNPKVSHLANAVDYILETNLDAREDKKLTLNEFKNDDEFSKFKEYFTKNVKLVRVEIPKDTDVASYFEIMNNRGEQLQKHELLKAYLLGRENIKNDNRKRKVLSEVWDACSQMDVYIQKSFNIKERQSYFGNNYDEFTFDIQKMIDNSIDDGKKSDSKNEDSSEKKTSTTINAILNRKLSFKESELNKESTEIEDIYDDYNQKSIIDFPNFLMHVFRLMYNESHKKKNNGEDIPLNEKDLIKVYQDIKGEIDPAKFISEVLRYRVIYDRYVVSSHIDEKDEDGYRWALRRPSKYIDNRNKKNSLRYKNTFGDENVQENIIKALSILQVTFRTRIYKNWLFELLGWFGEENIILSEEIFLNKIHDFMLKYYDESGFGNEIKKVHDDEELKQMNSYSEGTSTPHFLFNFIDYLYWFKDKDKFSFDFKYRNSVEHHLPQSSKGNENIIDNLGNLCLVSKSSNSRMSNEVPEGKALKGGKYYKETLPPKQKTMYDLTNNDKEWKENAIKKHYNQVVELLQNRITILDNSLKIEFYKK